MQDIHGCVLLPCLLWHRHRSLFKQYCSFPFFPVEVSMGTSLQHCPVHYWYGLSCPATFMRVTDLVFFPLSQHDTTLVALQMALDVYNKIQAPYASCHLFELYQEDDE